MRFNLANQEKKNKRVKFKATNPDKNKLFQRMKRPIDRLGFRKEFMNSQYLNSSIHS